MTTEKLHEELTKVIDFLDAGDPDTALKLLDSYLKHTDDDADAYFYRGDALAEARKAS